MKAIRAKVVHQQGLKEAYQSAIEPSRKKLEQCFKTLELKTKTVKTFPPDKNDAEIVEALNQIDSKITSDDTIPHHQAKLNNYPSLKKFMDKHLTKGLYMLQYRKCDDESCCQRKIDLLPPLVPAPVMSPDKVHYLPFDALYGKVKTTETDCPSLQPRSEKKDKNEAGHKYIASRVVSKVKCHQCGKLRCVFSLTRTLPISVERLLEDVIYVCGMPLSTSTGNCYTSRHVSCSSKIENAYYLSSSRSQFICVHCGFENIDMEGMKEMLRKYKKCILYVSTVSHKTKKKYA